jgi:hypothetical protein
VHLRGHPWSGMNCNQNCNWNLSPTIRLFESLHTALSAACTEWRASCIDEPTCRFGALRVIPGVLETCGVNAGQGPPRWIRRHESSTAARIAAVAADAPNLHALFAAGGVMPTADTT